MQRGEAMTTRLTSILETGTLTEHLDRGFETTRPFAIHLLGPEHLDEVVAVQQLVVDSLEDPSMFYPGPRELMAECLGPRGEVVGTFVEDRLVGFRSVLYPGDRDDNLGLDIALEGQDLLSAAHLDRTAVDPAYRGNRLQIRMTAHAIRLAVENSEWRHLFSTVAPGNFASMKDKFTAGLQIVRIKKKYMDYWRHVFYRDIFCPVDVDLATSVRVAGEDLDRQRTLVEEQGYVGYQLEPTGSGIAVLFAKPARAIRGGR